MTEEEIRAAIAEASRRGIDIVISDVVRSIMGLGVDVPNVEGATSMTDLTGYSPAAPGVLLESDTILKAFAKLEARIEELESKSWSNSFGEGGE